MDSKLIAKYLSKGGFKESSIVLDSGRSRAEKSSAVSGVRHKGGAVKVGSGNTEVSNATAVQSGITSASKGERKGICGNYGRNNQVFANG